MVPNSGDDSVSFSSDEDDSSDVPSPSKVDSFDKAEEVDGSLGHSETYDKLMRSVLENDKDVIDEGLIISEGMDMGLQSFTPDLMFEQITNNYKNAKQLYGDRLIRQLSGYDSSFVERNVKIPEFKNELRTKIGESVKSLHDDGFLDKDGVPTDVGLSVASLVMASTELEKMNRRGVLGEQVNHVHSLSGQKTDSRVFHSDDKFRDLALKASVKQSLRRGHSVISKDDLKAYNREEKERATIIYAIDGSGSMRGEKLAAAKRAGIALSFKATSKNDLVGLVIFGKEIEADVAPTKDFFRLIKTIVGFSAAKETDIGVAISHSIKLFSGSVGVKHLVLLTDGLHTIGKDSDLLEKVGVARKSDITVSVIGLGLDAEGESLTKKIVDIGGGTLYLVKSYEDVDLLLIEDYYNARKR